MFFYLCDNEIYTLRVLYDLAVILLLQAHLSVVLKRLLREFALYEGRKEALGQNEAVWVSRGGRRRRGKQKPALNHNEKSTRAQFPTKVYPLSKNIWKLWPQGAFLIVCQASSLAAVSNIFSININQFWMILSVKPQLIFLSFLNQLLCYASIVCNHCEAIQVSLWICLQVPSLFITKTRATFCKH